LATGKGEGRLSVARQSANEEAWKYENRRPFKAVERRSFLVE
jgi:hypothetical protein